MRGGEDELVDLGEQLLAGGLGHVQRERERVASVKHDAARVLDVVFALGLFYLLHLAHGADADGDEALRTQQRPCTVGPYMRRVTLDEEELQARAKERTRERRGRVGRGRRRKSNVRTREDERLAAQQLRLHLVALRTRAGEQGRGRGWASTGARSSHQGSQRGVGALHARHAHTRGNCAATTRGWDGERSEDRSLNLGGIYDDRTGGKLSISLLTVDNRTALIGGLVIKFGRGTVCLEAPHDNADNAANDEQNAHGHEDPHPRASCQPHHH